MHLLYELHLDCQGRRGGAQVPSCEEAEQLLKLRVVRLGSAEEEVSSLRAQVHALPRTHAPQTVGA